MSLCPCQMGQIDLKWSINLERTRIFYKGLVGLLQNPVCVVLNWSDGTHDHYSFMQDKVDSFCSRL